MVVKREIKGDEVILRKNGDVEDFFNVPKIKRKINVKELKKIYEEQYE